MPRELKAYCELMRLNRPIGILLLLCPTLWALWLASPKHFAVKTWVVFIIGTILMRSAGCVINDIADRSFDGYVQRTQFRPLVTGQISLFAAIVLFLSLILLSASLLYFLHPPTRTLAIIGVFLALIYPFCKRLFSAPQLILGVAFSWGIPMAYAEMGQLFTPQCVLLFIATLLWVVMYDTEYAMTDRLDDLKIGIKSTAILFGSRDRCIILILQCLILFLLILIGFKGHFSLWFYFSLLVCGLLFCYQQYLIKNRCPSDCFAAFMNNRWIGIVLFLGCLLS